MSLDGRVLAFTRRERVFVANGRARGRRQITGDAYHNPRLRPDGRELLVDVAVSGGTCIINLTSRRRRCTSPTQFLRWGTAGWLWANAFAIDPDGPTLCRERLGHDDQCDRIIFRGRPDNSYIVPNSMVSPDGRSIAVEEYPETQNEVGRIAVFNTRTLKPVRTLTRDDDDSQPVWSPDGRRILFVRDHLVGGPDGYVWELWTVPAGGGKARPLVKGGSTPDPVQTTWGG